MQAHPNPAIGEDATRKRGMRAACIRYTPSLLAFDPLTSLVLGSKYTEHTHHTQHSL